MSLLVPSSNMASQNNSNVAHTLESNKTFPNDNVSGSTLTATPISKLPHLGATNNESLANNSIANTTDLHDTGQWFDLPKMNNFSDLFSVCCSIAIIFGGVIPYVPQYLKIKRSMNSDGFSTYVCLTLLIANILRIMFWFGHPYELPLLIQSFVIIAGMLAMMEICVRVRDKSRASFTISAITGSSRRTRRFQFVSNHSHPILEPGTGSYQRARSLDGELVLSNDVAVERLKIEVPMGAINGNDQLYDSDEDCASFRLGSPMLNYATSLSSAPAMMSGQQVDSTTSGGRTIKCEPRKHLNKHHACLDSRDFWDWDDFFSYVKFLTLFTLLTGLLTYLLLDNHLYIELLGYVSLSTESMLGVPQLLRNYAKKSTLGMSVEMVIMWLSGDLFKMLYFIMRRAPVQFYVCGSTQIIVDIIILYQVLWYRRPSFTYRKLPESAT